MSPKLNSLVPGPCLPLQEISSKSVHNFFSYPTSHLTNSFCQSKHGYLAANSNYHYLKHFLPISITCKFHTFHIYRQIPLLVNSTGLPLLQNSIACKFLYNTTLPSKSITFKFRDSRFTAKTHYLQIQLLANSHNPI